MTVKTWFEEGIEVGVEQGMLTGQRRMLLALLENKFGALNDAARRRLDDLSADRLTDPGPALLRASSLAELGLELCRIGSPQAAFGESVRVRFPSWPVALQ